jgi:alpha/beta superfamily hydrolase
VQGETTLRIPGIGGGPSLDARIHVPPHPVRAVVLCHPHPLYGGSMHSPVPLAIAKGLADAAAGSAAAGPGQGFGGNDRVAWLRFDFRGVGASEGKYDDGNGEVDDARAAIEALRREVPTAPISLAGHSFGSWVGLRAAALQSPAGSPGMTGPSGGDARVERVLLVSPSVRFFDFRPEDVRFPGPITVFAGDQDELLDVAEAEALSAKLGASLRVFPGFDHHFLKSRRAMAEAALPVLVPEL